MQILFFFFFKPQRCISNLMRVGGRGEAFHKADWEGLLFGETLMKEYNSKPLLW